MERAHHRRAGVEVHASQPTMGAIGSCTWITSKSPPRSSARRRTTVSGVTDSRDIAPFIGSAAVRPSGTTIVGQRSADPAHADAAARVRRSSGSTGASTRTWWPDAMNSLARASICRVTPPGKLQE